jgi:threonine aldolase
VAKAAPKVLDFRSDTLTKPTDAMRKAMAEAEVGDDVFGEDPTVGKLEEVAAKRMGMEAAVFVPTGTMGNQLAIWTHTGRKGLVVCEENCHLALYEGGAASLLSNVMLRTIRSQTGTFTAEEMMRLFTPDDPHFAPTRLVSIENTHNYSGGLCWSRDQTRAIVEAAHRRKVPVHVDGARIFNAALAQKTTPERLLAGADSVMFCVSKGLSAPVGSLLCGTQRFVDEARHARKTLGGGMRQVGVIAAAGLVALESMVDRLAEDHANAKELGRLLAGIPGLRVDAASVQTNMVMVDVDETGMTSDAFVAKMKETGVLCLTRDTGPTVRFVTHRHISRDDVAEAGRRIRDALS